jgi:alpha-N-acetylglucosamine transferase
LSIGAALLLLFGLFVFPTTGQSLGTTIDSDHQSHNHDYNTSTTDRYAFVTWLASSKDEGKASSENLYLTATRLLVWQLLHDPETKSTGIDVVVMVGPKVNEADCKRLRKDGAIVRKVEPVHGQNDSWIIPKESRWGDIMEKLRAWEMEEYSRIAFLDNDTILQSPLDGVFDDPGVKVMTTKTDTGHVSDEPELPTGYLLSSWVEIGGIEHSWPPTERTRPGYFNGGFFLLKPDKKMFDYFVSLLDIPYRFDPQYMEQNLLNYAFRWDGAMPWQEINYKWNIKFTTDRDFDGGVVSMHEKFWSTRGGKKVYEHAIRKKAEMEGYYLAYDDQ